MGVTLRGLQTLSKDVATLAVIFDKEEYRSYLLIWSPFDLRI